ncbi:MAG TPA: hypothetical protein VGB70_02200 [Allosphingosinicella sp.]|jgi:hypothetical protein
MDAKWRKFSDVNRRFSLFELIISGNTMFDLGYNQDHVLEIAFHEGASNWVVSWALFEKIVQEGIRMADEDIDHDE